MTKRVAVLILCLAMFVAPAAVAPRLATAQLVTSNGPPPPREELPAPRTSSRDLWLKGYWEWTGNGYRWVPGHWERAPHRGWSYYEPMWSEVGGRWLFFAGHW